MSANVFLPRQIGTTVPLVQTSSCTDFFVVSGVITYSRLAQILFQGLINIVKMYFDKLIALSLESKEYTCMPVLPSQVARAGNFWAWASFTLVHVYREPTALGLVPLSLRHKCFHVVFPLHESAEGKFFDFNDVQCEKKRQKIFSFYRQSTSCLL